MLSSGYPARLSNRRCPAFRPRGLAAVVCNIPPQAGATAPRGGHAPLLATMEKPMALFFGHM